MAQRVLVISPHPDDLEIGCSGTLKKLSAQGYDIVSIITVRPSAEHNAHRSKDIVTKELKNSYRKSGWRVKIFNTDLHNNGRPNLVHNNITMSQLETLIEPADIAILPNPEDYHQDHSTTSKLAFPLVKQCNEIWYMHMHPYSLHYNTPPNQYVDISSQWQFKKSLLECYPSALNKQDIEHIETTNKNYALHTFNSSHAEAFTVVRKCM